MTTDFSRRRFLQAGLAAAVVAPLLSACNLDPAAKSAKESVRFSSYGDPTKLGLRSKLADQYTASHPEVKMTFEGTATAEYWDKLATQMAGGNAPDVINIDIARIGQYGAAGALQSLQKYIPDTIDAKSFDENLLSQGQLKGEQFGIPVAMGAYSMGYDVTVLDQLGLAHPTETWTWSDFATLANEIRQKSGKKIYGAEDPSGDTASLQIFLRGKGEDLYKDGSLAFTEDTLTEWFEYWAALRATGGTIPADIAAQAKYGDWPTSPLVKRQAALAHIHTPNLKGGFQDLTKNTIDITLPPRNTKDGKCGTFPAPSSYLSLNARSERADDAAGVHQLVHQRRRSREDAAADQWSARLVRRPGRAAEGQRPVSEREAGARLHRSGVEERVRPAAGQPGRVDRGQRPVAEDQPGHRLQEDLDQTGRAEVRGRRPQDPRRQVIGTPMPEFVTRNEQNPVTTGRIATWAVEQLVQALAEKGITAADAPSIRLATPDEVPAAELAAVPESYAVLRADGELVVVSNDETGLRCGLLELADRVAAGADLAGTTSFAEQPAVPVRGVVRSFSSVDEDLSWFHDRQFWTDYLTWLAASRFNRFHLALGMQYNYGADRHGATDNYLCFAYPFLFDVDGYDVKAEGVGADEQKRNLETLQLHRRRE